MSELVQGILIALIPALAVAIITSYVTVRLSIRQFYSQRWWDKKAEAYSQIMEHLSYLHYYFEAWYDEIEADITISQERKQELSKGYRQSRESITKAAAIGSYIVSDTTITALRSLLHKFTKSDLEGDLAAVVKNNYEAIIECMPIVREEAKKDLQKGI